MTICFLSYSIINLNTNYIVFYRENIVNIAQDNGYYLTFYPARHIFAFYDYHMETDSQIETCQTLLSFVNRNAKLSQLKSQEFSCERDKYDRVLEEINDRL